MEDLSGLLPGGPLTALAPTSQAGGNMSSDNKLAMTAPGSPPVDPLPPAKQQDDPAISASNSRQIQPGTTGKPNARAGGMTAGRPAWTRTASPEVVRED